MRKTLNEMPKIDLHCHLDGSMGIAITKELLHKTGKEYEEAELRELLQAPEDCPGLAEYLKRFELPIQCIQTKEGLEKAAFDLAKSAAEENVKYMEVRFAPSFCTVEGLSVRETIESVNRGLKKAEAAQDIQTGIIVCAMRNLTMETNFEMLKEARELFGECVVACDLAGDEKAYPNALYRDFFETAAGYGIPYTIHSGECGSRDNIKAAIGFGAKRIGHGIAMGDDPELMKLCAAKHIGVEMCPTSNFQTKAAHSWEEYPLRRFLEAGVPVSINTDNRTVSGINSTMEFERVTDHCDLTEEELYRIYQASVDMAFADDDCKEKLLKKWSE